MANPNPSKARRAKRRRSVQRAGDLCDVRHRLWEAVEAASDIVRTADDDAVRLRGVHAVTQSAASYVKLLEATEFEARLKALEDAAGL